MKYMTNSYEKGDLVFIPSSVKLFQFREKQTDAQSSVSKHTITYKPRRGLLMDAESYDEYYKILYDGEYWFANKQDVYGGS